MENSIYQNGKIYSLRNLITDDEYVGSTIQSLSMRKHGHKSLSVKGTSKLYTSIREHGIDNFKIVLIESYACNSRDELLAREDYYIRERKPVLNTLNAVSNKEKEAETAKKYREQNKDKIKEYREQNKNKIAVYLKEYRDENKEKLSKKKKEYYEKNIEKFTQQKREYYEKNKAKLSQKVLCAVCETDVCKSWLNQHNKTKTHLANLNNQ